MNRTMIGLALGLIVGLVGGYYYARHQPGPQPVSGSEPPTDRKALFYRNPMNPAVTSPVPAKDEMGMDYVPVYAEAAVPRERGEPLYYRSAMNPAMTSPVPAKDEMGMDYVPVYADTETGTREKPGTVRIDPLTTQNIGVRTAPVVIQTLAKKIRAVGRVAYDEQGLRRLHPKTEGWIEELFVDETGVAVEVGTILLDLYSPQLVSSQQEYLLALNNRAIFAASDFEDIRGGAEHLVQSARARLELLDVPEHQIVELEQTKEIKKNLHIHSPFRGIVVNIGAREGQFVTAQTEIYMIADLSRVWVYADVYEDDLPWIKVGNNATMNAAGIPGESFEGKVTYIYPYLESASRTIRVRLEFENQGLRLKPDMYSNVNIEGEPQVDALVVPSEAIVRSGAREIVFVIRDGGQFEPREVVVGINAEGLTQVLDGLKNGERVVTSGQFLIDSESKLREATAKMIEAMGSESGSGGRNPPSSARTVSGQVEREPATQGQSNGGTDAARASGGERGSIPAAPMPQ